MQINLIADNSVASAPAGFVAMVQAAAAIYEQAFSGNYTVNITYGWGTLDNQVSPDLTNPNSGIFSLGGFNNSTDIDYATMKSWFVANAAIASLPASYTGLPNYASLPGNPNSYLVTSAQEKALGVFFGDASSVDGSIGFNTGDLSVEPVADWEQAALQEIGHALGWNTGYVISEGDVPSVLDLFRYGSAGNLQWTDGQPAYFSLNGGGTDVANYLTVGDYTLFSNAGDVLGDNDPFALPQTGNPATATLTSLDTEIFNILGFASAGSATADMIMRDGGNGDFEIYDLGGNAILAAAPMGQVGPEWKVAGFGSFGGDAGDMLMRDSNSGAFEVYDISNNAIVSAGPMGQVGLEWSVAGFGDFSTRPNETDMLMRNTSTGTFEIYDIGNNMITSAAPMGQVGLEWSVAGFGDFSTQPNETDMLMRNSNTGSFEVYDIANNTITSAAAMGQVGMEWQVAGFGDFSGRAGETDMLMRNSNTGAFEVYDISHNAITSSAAMGQIGLEWQIAGFGDFSGNADETDMLMRNSNTGAFELYDIINNTITLATGMGQVGLEWAVAGISTGGASSPPRAQLSGSAVDPVGTTPSSATNQLAQAMASFALSAGTTATASLLQAPEASNTTSLLTATNHPQPIS